MALNHKTITGAGWGFVAARFLAADQAAMVTGVALDGGRCA